MLWFTNRMAYYWLCHRNDLSAKHCHVNPPDSLEDCRVDCQFSVERQICRWESWYLNFDRKQKPQSKHIYAYAHSTVSIGSICIRIHCFQILSSVNCYRIWSLDEFTPKKRHFLYIFCWEFHGILAGASSGILGPLRTWPTKSFTAPTWETARSTWT